MKEPIFLKPVFQERIWGGTALHDRFDYDIPSPHTGECWAISAHSNGPSIISSGPWAGNTLQDLWKHQPHLFGSQHTDEFPLLVKILDANDNLSVQVHPDDTYAKKIENGSLGKTECWYIIDCEKDSKLIFGHNAKTKEELQDMIANKRWSSLLKQVPIKPGDFFFVPSGTVHAIGKGTLILEVQQSSDVTYRLYDYDRTDTNGSKRELHLDKAIDVIRVPSTLANIETQTTEYSTYSFTTLIESPYFCVYKVNVHSYFTYEATDTYALLNVLKGTGTVTIENHSYPISTGSHFLLPYKCGVCTIEGNVELIISHP